MRRAKSQTEPTSLADNGDSPRSRAYSVAEVADLMGGLKPHLVLSWIKSGELRAIDVRARVVGSSRPRWKILVDDLDAFIERRAARPVAPQTRRRSKPAKATTEPVGRRW